MNASASAGRPVVVRAGDWLSFRAEARALLADDIAPDRVAWEQAGQASLFGERAPAKPGALEKAPRATFRVPSAFVERAEIASENAAPDRFAVLYRLLWKTTHGAHDVMDDPLDPDAARLRLLVREIHQEEHRMHAFVRFRPVRAEDGSEHYVGWYAPAHRVLERVAPFFARRYPNQPWSLFTPDASAHWDGDALSFGPGAPRSTAPGPDELDALFLDYYANIYNPARANKKAYQKHIIGRIQAQLPEGALLTPLLRASEPATTALLAKEPSASAALLPVVRDLDALREAASSCRACPIGARATQTVFGEGPREARLMIVGEQPGDEEDLAGRPFVGPAGRLLEEYMQRAGLGRDRIYVTNAVKHFKWEPRGKRRIHSKPSGSEIKACNAWLLAEVDAVRPRMILCLGATAAQSFCGPGFRISRDRGKPSQTPWSPWWMASFHPSALLRADDLARPAMEAALFEDLQTTALELSRIEIEAEGRA